MTTCAPRSKSSSAMEGVMPKPPAEFSPLMMSEIDGVGFHDVGQVLADDVAARRRPEDVADEENIHSVSLSRVCAKGFESRRVQALKERRQGSRRKTVDFVDELICRVLIIRCWRSRMRSGIGLLRIVLSIALRRSRLRLPAFGGSLENRRLAAAWLGMPVGSGCLSRRQGIMR